MPLAFAFFAIDARRKAPGYANARGERGIDKIEPSPGSHTLATLSRKRERGLAALSPIHMR
jgi:hypothetical protein